ncbi:uncharacterized protein MKK02DRAFT_30801 [Dioszegia hungarica]|uniref:Uncharacterized protein n=1 Tax=Dioszegia hungarica TaxID=4972 RepID=A0AA38LQP8_9TREE|nr:uncharacterized protein MKK02DRAFT_30801 [Dioszegia hungarica]KAI9631798.1 hypothetical protein MKK02DRAFT_30801 [Dioszegia hungarica]
MSRDATRQLYQSRAYLQFPFIVYPLSPSSPASASSHSCNLHTDLLDGDSIFFSGISDAWSAFTGGNEQGAATDDQHGGDQEDEKAPLAATSLVVCWLADNDLMLVLPAPVPEGEGNTQLTFCTAMMPAGGGNGNAAPPSELRSKLWLDLPPDQHFAIIDPPPRSATTATASTLEPLGRTRSPDSRYHSGQGPSIRAPFLFASHRGPRCRHYRFGLPQVSTNGGTPSCLQYENRTDQAGALSSVAFLGWIRYVDVLVYAVTSTASLSRGASANMIRSWGMIDVWVRLLTHGASPSGYTYARGEAAILKHVLANQDLARRESRWPGHISILQNMPEYGTPFEICVQGCLCLY